jgi:hypothetical protein
MRASITKTNKLLLYREITIVFQRTIHNAQVTSAGKMLNFAMLNLVVFKVTTVYKSFTQGLQKLGWEDMAQIYTHLLQDRAQCLPNVYTLINLWVPQNTEHFLNLSGPYPHILFR